MFFDPMYCLFILPGLGLSLWASARVKRTFNRYAKVWSRRGFTGAQAAVAPCAGRASPTCRLSAPTACCPTTTTR